MAAITRVQAPAPVIHTQISPVHVALVGPSLHTWLGGQEVQLDSLARCWTRDASVQIVRIPNNPKLPRLLAPAENVPVLRTLLRFPLYLHSVWRGARQAEIVHASSASHSSFLLAPL